MSLAYYIIWFTDLKNSGVSKDEILDVLEFDSDFYPDLKVLEAAKEIVYVSQSEQEELEAAEKRLALSEFGYKRWT